MEEKIETLKKRLRFMGALIGILSFVTLASFVYCYVQIRRAKEELELARNYEQIAERNSELEQCKLDLFKASMIAQKSAEEALKQKKLAEASAVEAMKQHQRAEEALKKISKK